MREYRWTRDVLAELIEGYAAARASEFAGDADGYIQRFAGDESPREAIFHTALGDGIGDAFLGGKPKDEIAKRCRVQLLGLRPATLELPRALRTGHDTSVQQPACLAFIRVTERRHEGTQMQLLDSSGVKISGRRILATGLRTPAEDRRG